MTQLLVSVRSVDEAKIALEAGADIIDVKEPARGSLGPADDATIAAVITTVGGRVPVSVALGEWFGNHTFPQPACLAGAQWAKVAFSNAPRDFQPPFSPAHPLVKAGLPCRVVYVAYADHQRASAPSFERIFSWAKMNNATSKGPPGILIDTFEKDGNGLLSWFTLRDLMEFHHWTREAGLFLALAGSLCLDDVKLLMKDVRPESPFAGRPAKVVSVGAR